MRTGINRNSYPPEWKAITTRLKAQANYTCQKCNRKADRTKGIQLAVHHIDGNTQNNRDTNLIVLCRKCHLLEELKKAP